MEKIELVLHALHLCSGYGGFEIGLKIAGLAVRTVCHVEREAHAAATLVARMEDQTLDLAPIWDEVETFDTSPWVGKVDIITAGFPCQPFSRAGRNQGIDDDRWLWPGIFRIVRDLGPGLIFLENVPGLIDKGLPEILSDLTTLGYNAEWGMYTAKEVGAPHIRERIFILGWHPDGLVDPGSHGFEENCISFTGQSKESILGHSGQELDGGDGLCDGVDMADSDIEGLQSLPEDESGDQGCHFEPRDPLLYARFKLHSWPPGRNAYEEWRDFVDEGGPEPGICRVVDGRPEGMAESITLGGNGLVPQMAAKAFLELAERVGLELPATTTPEGL